MLSAGKSVRTVTNFFFLSNLLFLMTSKSDFGNNYRIRLDAVLFFAVAKKTQTFQTFVTIYLKSFEKSDLLWTWLLVFWIWPEKKNITKSSQILNNHPNWSVITTVNNALSCVDFAAFTDRNFFDFFFLLITSSRRIDNPFSLCGVFLIYINHLWWFIS